jgi:hypothetical protein
MKNNRIRFEGMTTCAKDLPLDELSSTELLAGVVLYTGQNTEQKFPEQAVYALFKALAEQNPALASRFRLKGSPGRWRSEPLKRILNFLEMGKILEVPQPNPVDQYYKPRKSQMDSLKNELEFRGVLPRFEPIFAELSSRLAEPVTACR